MPKIVAKKILAETIVRMDVEAPEIARRRKAGQFVVLRLHEKGERIPLTIVDSDYEKGTITLIFQVVGKTTAELAMLDEGSEIKDLLGPLGHPTEIEPFGRVICVGGGVGVGVIYPITKALKEEGNYVISIIGARTRDLIILEREIGVLSDEFVVCTDDGSYGFKGFVTQALEGILREDGNIDRVFAVGPVPMMRAVADVTRPYNIKTIVSLNPIMVDATGMCGACRVSIGGKTKFACVDGPEFDGHEVDFDLLMKRLKIYVKEEAVAYERHKCGFHGS
ncbi:MAG: sulfide/dihydroorotate dehydrogenase-like FAD/NAD-binding protein [Syntrophales bacterium]|nr:sulfide/dihydroorotate dehydrogenase-like FAD/NAD-binding protein [Syntrophales bacterium]